MSRKRYLSIFAIIVLLFIVGAIVAIKQIFTIRNDQPQMIEACQNALLAAGYTVYQCGNTQIYSTPRYEGTTFSHLSIALLFDDGTNDMWCEVQRNDSKWVVTRTGTTIVGMCP